MIGKNRFTKVFAVISSVLLLSAILGGCGGKTGAAEPTGAPAGTVEPAPSPSEAEADMERQDGERFETVVVLEGMEETVLYEHVRNETAGIELDYDCELLERRSGSGRELFVPQGDNSTDPWNYLEVAYNAEDADTVSAAVYAALADDFDTVVKESVTLARAGRCVQISASGPRGSGYAPGAMLTVYVIPAADGCRVARAHCTVESAEGFGARFSDMVNTLAVIDSHMEGRLTDEQALAAVRNYCLAGDPELESIIRAGEYPVYWDVSSSDDQEIVVLFRSYTGALIRFYIDPVSGETYITEFVPGITPQEQRTEETLNIREYLD